MTQTLAFSSPSHVASLLRWWQDAGLTDLIEENPVPWLGRSQSRAGPVRVASETVQNRPVPLPATLTAFSDWMRTVDRAEFGPAHLRVATSGPPTAELMIFCDMPDISDHERGALLTGESTALLEKMLAAIGRTRDTVYLVPFSPARPASAMISEHDLAGLGAIARHHLMLARPKALWIMGGATSRALLGTDANPAIPNLHQINHEGVTVTTTATLAPSFLLKNPRLKGAAWAAMQMLVKGMKS